MEVGNGWPKDAGGGVALKYFFETVTNKMDQNTVRSEVERAFQVWASYANVTFSAGQVQGAVRSIDILFASGAHGDAYPFDGPGGVLAHTFYPAPINGEPIAGDMHFDADESWHAGSSVDLFSVALHETGHALGLGHSSNPGAVMYPYYRMQTGLTSDDIAGIQALYGAVERAPARASGHHARPTARAHAGDAAGDAAGRGAARRNRPLPPILRRHRSLLFHRRRPWSPPTRLPLRSAARPATTWVWRR